MDYFKTDESTSVSLRNQYLNSFKMQKVDPNRQNYVENNLSLPPTFLQNPAAAVNIKGSQIILGGNS
jgi:hypothetical protein